ncbi:2-hydroxy-muconic semialdehyde hydrolase [Azoarcus olearius]|uniref:alpha/beta fold hydrolase n=1 Tax=Azoarcus sp. (strain BH72) TaxID=418699 RepID=UPI0008063D90|nr:alpha/beta fold hydrolase [Azoarcus olearius]ANQ85160.1 2-hydroxy-muconic semialdehyde hydrolase [Azoarcus olearius]
MSQNNPELGSSIEIGSVRTNYHDLGKGFPVLMIHGSGPGVSGYVNWRTVMNPLAEKRRVLIPDMLGFGFTERKPDQHYDVDAWIEQAIGLLDALDLPRADIVGNSFGGALALKLAIRHPKRIRRIVLMGSAGLDFPLTEGLDAVWGYEPSPENMRRILDIFAFNRSLITDDLARLRYEASIQPGFQEAFAAMFPPPRQRWVSALASAEDDLRRIPHETLLVHGREDRVIPLASSVTLAGLIPRAQLHVFGRCGHWTQIEQAARFIRLVADFLDEADSAEPRPLD